MISISWERIKDSIGRIGSTRRAPLHGLGLVPKMVQGVELARGVLKNMRHNVPHVEKDPASAEILYGRRWIAERETPGPGKTVQPLLEPDADAEVRQKLQAIAAAGRLAPIFRTRFQRWARLLVLPDGSHIELALDQGNILVGELSCPISEIELELKAGHPRALFDLALALLPDLTLHPEQRSKAERGYALHSGESVRPYRVPPPRLDTDMDSGFKDCSKNA